MLSNYWLISLLGKLEYYYLIGDYGERDPEFIHDQWPGLDNITISIEKVAQMLKQMNIEA